MARIKIKNSQVKDKAPLPADLVAGEIAVNTHADSPAIYLKDTAGAIVKIAGAGAIGGTPASETAAGIVELATAAETTAGTDNTRAVHPAGLKVELDKKAPLASPALTGTPTAPTAPAGTSTTQVATTAFVQQEVGGADAPDGTADGTKRYVRQVVTTGTGATPVDTKTWEEQTELWTRSGTVVSPSNAGDAIQLSATGTAPATGAGIYSPGADQLALSTSGVGRMFVDASGNVSLSSTTSLISTNTADAADNKRLILTGGGAIGVERGAYINLQGNEFPGGGNVTLAAGDNGYINLNTGAGVQRLRIDSTGVVTVGSNSATPAVSLDPGTTGSPLVRDSLGRVLVGTSSAVAGSAALLQATTTINLAGVAVYADNAAAKAGGLVDGDVYRTATGQLMIAYT